MQIIHFVFLVSDSFPIGFLCGFIHFTYFGTTNGQVSTCTGMVRALQASIELENTNS